MENQVVFHVSPDGNDAWSGLLPEADARRRDGPFATLERARGAVRAAKAGRRSVELAGGLYPLGGGFVLDAADSGTEASPVVWRARDGASARIAGSRAVRDWRPVQDEEVLARLPPGARGNVLRVDLAAEGIEEVPRPAMRGGPPLEIHFRDRRMSMARFPNRDWLLIADVPQGGPKRFHDGLEREKRFDGVPVGRHYGRIAFREDEPCRWSPDGEIYVHGYWTWDWSDSYQVVQSIDAAAKVLTIAEPHHGYGYTRNQRYCFLNVLERLDEPGDWVLDRAHRLVYLWPPQRPEPGDLRIATLTEPLLTLRGARHVRWQGVDFCQTLGGGAVVEGGGANEIRGCRFYATGGQAVALEGGERSRVEGCDVFDVGMGGISLRGGDRAALRPAHHEARNNHVHHYGQWLRTGQYAFLLDGVGQRVAHNLVHDAPHEAVSVQGNDHLIEYNEFHDVCQETGDAGALHTGRNWTWRGNVIRWNYWHDLKGPGLHGVAGVYLDDWASGFHVYGNLFYRAGRATLIGGGRDNHVEHNVYIECRPALHLDARGLGWAKYYFDGTYNTLFETYEAVRADKPPYVEKYPALRSLPYDEPACPKNNRIVGNLSCGGRWLDIYDFNVFHLRWITVQGNVSSDPVACRRLAEGWNGMDPYYLNIDGEEGYEHLPPDDARLAEDFPENVFREAPFLRFDPGKREILVTDPSAVPPGFPMPPLSEMGLRRDAGPR